MAEIIARFADGRLLVQEERTLPEMYVSGGIRFRIGLVRTVEKVLSIDAYMSGQPEYKVAVPLNEALPSNDTVLIKLRRNDIASGGMISGLEMIAAGVLSGVTSGLRWNEELTSANLVSGKLRILANVIGF